MRPYLSSILTMMVATSLSACAGPPARAEIDWTGLEVAHTAREMLGKPYCYGGVTEKGFDCSGLVRYAYGRAGLTIPRTAADQYRSAMAVDPGELQPGDLLFFRPGPERVSHVGIYVGDGHFIHTPSSGKSVCYDRIDAPHWQRQLAGAGRFYQGRQE